MIAETHRARLSQILRESQSRDSFNEAAII